MYCNIHKFTIAIKLRKERNHNVNSHISSAIWVAWLIVDLALISITWNVSIFCILFGNSKNR